MADTDAVEGAGRRTATGGRATEGVWVVLLAMGFLVVLAVWSVVANLARSGAHLARQLHRTPSDESASPEGIPEPAVVRAKAA